MVGLIAFPVYVLTNINDKFYRFHNVCTSLGQTGPLFFYYSSPLHIFNVNHYPPTHPVIIRSILVQLLSSLQKCCHGYTFKLCYI